MRIARHICVVLAIGAAMTASPGLAFEGTAVDRSDTALPIVAAQPNGAAALKKAVAPPAAPTALSTLQYAAEGGHRERSGNWARCMPAAMASPMTICAPSIISAGSPTPMPRTIRRRRRRRSSRTPSWRSVATT